MKHVEVDRFVQLWISEGIPFVFQSAPFLYATIRDNIAHSLDICPKAISMTGSARLGYSLRPKDSWGKPYSQGSDFDFFIVSEKLFQQTMTDYKNWESDYKIGKVMPNNQTEYSYWNNNLNLLPRNISRGFIDPWKLPNYPQYPTSTKVNQVAYYVKKKIMSTDNLQQIKPRKVTFRIYKGWENFISQASLNIKDSARRTKNNF